MDLRTIAGVHASLPTLAPIAGFLVLLELAAGTVAAAYLIDAIGRVGRGFVGTTAVICAIVMGAALLIGVNLPTDTQLVDGSLSQGPVSGLIHWCLGFTGALLAFAFFCAVGTDAARRVVGAATLVTGAVTIAEAATAFGPALGGAAAAAVTFAPAEIDVAKTDDRIRTRMIGERILCSRFGLSLHIVSIIRNCSPIID